MKEIVISLLAYITQVTGLGFNEYDTPEIKSVSTKTIATIRLGGNVPTDFDFSALGATALYDHRNNIIYIDKSIDTESVFGKSVLLHELVHFVQYQNDMDKKVPCQFKLEPLAYKVQNQYLYENGIKHLLFDERHIFFTSLCDDSMY